MITINGNAHPWVEGLTVQAMLDAVQFPFVMRVVTVNGVYVPPETHTTHQLNDRDNVRVVPLAAGG